MGDQLKHYGTPRHSGRYPWGSGQDPYQRAIGFRGHIEELHARGLSDVEIARYEGIKTTQLRARLSIAKDEQRAAERTQALKLKEKGYSNMEIGRQMGKNESSIRNLLDPVLAERATITKATANVLKAAVDEKRFIDVGAGVSNQLGVSPTKLNTALAELQEQGYKIHTINLPQMGMPGKFTITKALGTPDSEWKEIVPGYGDPSKIKSVMARSDDFGRTYTLDGGMRPVEYISSKRVSVRYAEDGGKDKDGVIELRRGVKDLDLGGAHYAQVRIGVDGSHYLKGMAVYTDKMPPGVDIIFNTNKGKDTPMMGSKDNSVLKPVKKDKDGVVDSLNPFGASIKPFGQRGALNVVNEEGDWGKWSKTISSQVLSKQTVPVAKTQLGLALTQKKEEYEEIISLTNPVVKKQLLMEFGDGCDAAAVHLKAAALPRQASKVILPLPNIKPTEVYAPSFRDGEMVVLIRHPHAGTFEIPQLKVNNKSQAGRDLMGTSPLDAVGIHPDVAKKLSGADFDGDTVIVIPNNRDLIKTSRSIDGLENFDPVEKYAIPEGSNIPKISPRTKQTKMGEVSNLITDMTIKGATLDEISRAVRHSMVVIDSEKHNLNYRQSYIDNGIAALSEKYQNGPRGGASTLISKASSEIRVPERTARKAQEGGPIDPETGKRIYVETGSFYVNKKGKIIKRTTSSTKMAETDDAFTLSSGRQIEEVYASYANSLKALGNMSRKNALAITPIPYNPSAKAAYSKEVEALNRGLDLALMNKPLERQAQMLANSILKRQTQANPDMDHDELKKIRNQALAEARVRTGAKKTQVTISYRQWEAIQAGAISPSKLSQILQNADPDRVKQLATPRTKLSMTPTKVERARLMLDSGATLAEVSDALGVSVSTLSNSLKG